MKTLAAIHKNKTEARIVPVLEQSLPVISHPRSVWRVHASDLTRGGAEETFCPREIILHQVLHEPRLAERIGMSLRLTFDEGIDRQRRLNNDWLRNVMVGSWRCRRCHAFYKWGKAPITPCNAGEGVCDYEYREVLFRHDSGFEGSPDGIVDLGLPKLRIMEAKIMGKDQFKDLKMPLGEHAVRTRLYLKLIAESGHHSDEIDTSRAHILYIMRGHGMKDSEQKGQITPFKEFIVERKDSDVEVYVRMATAVKESRASEYQRIPARTPVCTGIGCPRARICGVAKACYSGKYNEDLSW